MRAEGVQLPEPIVPIHYSSYTYSLQVLYIYIYTAAALPQAPRQRVAHTRGNIAREALATQAQIVYDINNIANELKTMRFTSFFLLACLKCTLLYTYITLLLV